MKEPNRQLHPHPGVQVRRVTNEGGSAPTEARPLNRLHPIDEGSGPVASMPAADTNRAHPPESLTDGCPSCVVNVEPPRSVTTLAIGFRAAYLCSDCGHAWTTDWKD